MRKRVRELEQELNRVKKQRSAGSSDRGGKGDGKGDKSRRDRKSNQPMPKGLSGKSSRTAAGDSICFGFNLGSCTGAAPGGKCNRGMHVCAEPGCEKPHKLSDHRA